MPFDPDQPRDENGQWTDGNADVAIKSAASQKNVVVVTNPADAKTELEKMIKEKKITEDEVAAVSSYTGADYPDINQPLRKGIPPDDNIGYRRTIHDLDSFLEKAPKYNGLSYRGIRFFSEDGFNSFLKDANDDGILEDEAFGSTTTEKSNIKIFSLSGMTRYSVEITVKGKNGVYVDPISSMSTEQEVLFPRKTKFKVNNVKVEDVTREDESQGYRDLKKKALLEIEEL